MKRQPEVLSGGRVYEGKLLKIDRESVRLPNGSIADLETIRHPGAAAAVPFLGPDEVVLISQYRHAARGTIVEVPAGKLDPGEAPEACIERELVEEIGYRPSRLTRLGRILTTPGFTDEVIWLYEAHDLERCRTDHQEDEVIEPLRLSFGEAVAMVERGEIADAKSVAALLLAARRRSP
jgi:ADP-ribose pyrophosphatase